jgi:hypothetical protein
MLGFPGGPFQGLAQLYSPSSRKGRVTQDDRWLGRFPSGMGMGLGPGAAGAAWAAWACWARRSLTTLSGDGDGLRSRSRFNQCRFHGSRAWTGGQPGGCCGLDRFPALTSVRIRVDQARGQTRSRLSVIVTVTATMLLHLQPGCWARPGLALLEPITAPWRRGVLRSLHRTSGVQARCSWCTRGPRKNQIGSHGPWIPPPLLSCVWSNNLSERYRAGT